MHHYSISHISLSATFLTQTFQLSTSICEKIMPHCTNTLILSFKNDDDDLQKNVLISNYLVPIMLHANDNSNDSRNTSISTALQSIWNYLVATLKNMLSSLLSSLTSKEDVTMRDGRSSQFLLPTACKKTKQNADFQL